MLSMEIVISQYSEEITTFYFKIKEKYQNITYNVYLHIFIILLHYRTGL
jgi:hypothetical protein